MNSNSIEFLALSVFQELRRGRRLCPGRARLRARLAPESTIEYAIEVPLSVAGTPRILWNCAVAGCGRLDTSALNLYEVYTIAHQMVGLRWLRDVCAPARVPRRPHLDRPKSPVPFSSFFILSNAGRAILQAG